MRKAENAPAQTWPRQPTNVGTRNLASHTHAERSYGIIIGGRWARKKREKHGAGYRVSEWNSKEGETETFFEMQMRHERGGSAIVAQMISISFWAVARRGFSPLRVYIWRVEPVICLRPRALAALSGISIVLRRSRRRWGSFL